MFSDFVLIHRKGSQGASAHKLESSLAGWFFWKTCLRMIAIGEESQLVELRSRLQLADDAEVEVLRGEAAYRFLLQVICGLHSPVVGETEVSGQFRNAVAAYTIPATPFGTQLQRLFRHLFEDAKRVRQAHLSDLGSQSYGSVLRRETRSLSKIHILGAGHLVQEILPWIVKDGKQIHIHCRNVEKARLELGALVDLDGEGKVKFHSLSETTSALAQAEALVIAAPVASAWLADWMPQNTRPRIIADLRADSAEDRVSGGDQVLDLQDFFALLSKNQEQLEARKCSALVMIESIAEDRSRHVENRPFGWEDVCA